MLLPKNNKDFDRENPVKTATCHRVLFTVIFFEKRLLSDSFLSNLEYNDFKTHNLVLLSFSWKSIYCQI